MSEEKKAIVRRFFKAFANSDQDTLRQLMAPDHTFHHHALGPVDRERHLQGIRALTAAFSDIRLDIEEQIADDDLVATRLIWRAVHSGAFQGHPPTHKEIAVSGISMERVEDGRIVERWFIQD